MSDDYAVKLACDVVHDHFGEAVAQTCTVLLTKGAMTLSELLAQTNLPYTDLRNHLLVLMQQNIVFARSKNDKRDEEEDNDGEGGPIIASTKGKQMETGPAGKKRGATTTTTPNAKGAKQTTTPSSGVDLPLKYEASLTAILLRLRFSKFSLHIQDKFGDCAQLVFEEILEHGRLTADQCTTQALAVYQANPIDEETKTQEDFATLMLAMIKERYIEPVKTRTLPTQPPATPTSAQNQTQSQAQPASTNKRKASATENTTPARANKRSRTSGLKATSNADNNIPFELLMLQGSLGLPTSSNNGSSSTAAANSGVDLSSAQALLTQHDDVLWCANLARFNHDFRNEAVAQLVKDKVNAVASKIVQTILRLTVVSQRTRADYLTAPVSVDRLLAAINAEEEDSSTTKSETMTRDMLCNILDLLCRQQPPLLQHSHSGGGGSAAGGSYSVCLGAACELLRHGLVDSIVLERFGVLGCRIFRLLQQHVQLEQKAVSDFAMVPLKDCREILYKMFAAGFLEVQELPRSADRAASRTLFLWKVGFDELCQRLYKDVLRTLWNVRRRRAHELKQAADLTKAFETRPDTLTDAQRKHLTQLMAIVDRLDKAMLQLDDTTEVLADFFPEFSATVVLG